MKVFSFVFVGIAVILAFSCRLRVDESTSLSQTRFNKNAANLILDCSVKNDRDTAKFVTYIDIENLSSYTEFSENSSDERSEGYSKGNITYASISNEALFHHEKFSLRYNKASNKVVVDRFVWYVNHSVSSPKLGTCTIDRKPWASLLSL